jgi:hypothetical protein
MDDGVGRTLREARTARAIDLADVAAVTKVREEFLRAIEDEEWDRLPGEAYARAFVRTYASYLGLDADELAERQRRQQGVAPPPEALPRVPPEPLIVATESRPGAWRGPGLALAAIVAVLAVVLGIVLIVSGGGGGGPSRSGSAPRQAGARNAPSARGEEPPATPPGHVVSLTATAEVWVCLLDGRGEPLIDGQILEPGSSEGPYRSGNFTVSLGNGQVTMTVDGERASIPETPSPIGYSIEGGALRQLSEGERPTCT